MVLVPLSFFRHAIRTFLHDAKEPLIFLECIKAGVVFQAVGIKHPARIDLGFERIECLLQF